MGKQNLVTIQLFAITGILISILVSLVAFRQFILPVSQADAPIEAEKAPYLKLVQVPSIETSKIIVEVIANTGGQPVMASDVVLAYDPTTLSIEETGIESTGALAVIQKNQFGNGQVNVSLFSSPDREEPMLQTNADQEIVILKLTFYVINPEMSLTQLQFAFEPGSVMETNLIQVQAERSENLIDVLKTVEGVNLTLTNQ